MPVDLPERSLNRSYSVDLAEHIEVCEKNYHRLILMLPKLREGQKQWCFEAGSEARIQVTILLKESAPYTSVVEVQQRHANMDLPAFLLRLYHDADVTEVIAFDGHRQWQPKYDYPNPRMYQPNEKQALNRFLFDWLVFCRKHGLALTHNCEPVLVSRKS